MSYIPGIDDSAYEQVSNLYLRKFGYKVESAEQLTPHGSERIILRLKSSSENRAVAVINNRVEENLAFIAFGKHFRKFGINVPEIFSVSDDKIIYLMQDLGDTTLLDKITLNGRSNFSKNEIELYTKVIHILPEFQIRAGSSIDYSYCYQFSEFGEENIRFDLDYFYKRFLQIYYKSEIMESELKADFDALVKELLGISRQFFLYRDFQSRNIMISGDDLYFIDFQSGRRGALLYDIASLLYDAKAGIPVDERSYLAEYYLDFVKTYTNINKSEYYEFFWYFALIRILQAMGAYGYLGLVRGKTKFLESIPLALKNISYILENKINNKQFPYLKRIFKEIQYEKT